MSTNDVAPADPPTPDPSGTDVLIVGAGMAGLTAAHALSAAGLTVRVVDKGRAPGGRVATRRVGDATFDHGAQFLTARDPRFQAMVADWRRDGVVRTWFTGLPDLIPRNPQRAAADDEPRLRGTPTMRTIAEHLATGLDLHLGVELDAIARTDTGWRADGNRRDGTGDGQVYCADRLVLTAPVPQSLALLAGGEVTLADDATDVLQTLGYDPCLAVLMVPDGPTDLPDHGALRLDHPPLSFLTDNLSSGASATPAVTIHGDVAISRELWEASDERIATTLIDAAQPLLGTSGQAVDVHRWRYAAPTDEAAEPALLAVDAGAPIAFAGDAFLGGRIEGAALSGLAAARLVADAGTAR